jgi:hypothetical protein
MSPDSAGLPIDIPPSPEPAGPAAIGPQLSPEPLAAPIPVHVLPMSEALPATILPAIETIRTAPPAWATWAAILVTSVIFAVVHPAWTAPAIFLLSLCLGYAYERTGNLWVPILIHAAFNTTSTLLYLGGLSN